MWAASEQLSHRSDGQGGGDDGDGCQEHGSRGAQEECRIGGRSHSRFPGGPTPVVGQRKMLRGAVLWQTLRKLRHRFISLYKGVKFALLLFCHLSAHSISASVSSPSNLAVFSIESVYQFQLHILGL